MRRIVPCMLIFLALVSSVPAAEDSDAFLDEDFIGTEPGDLPSGWTGADAVGVRKKDDAAWLEASVKGMHRVRPPRRAIRGDFEMEADVLLSYSSVYSSELELTLVGDGGPDLIVRLVHVPSADIWEVRLGDSSQRVKAAMDRANRLRLIRRGTAYRLIVNDETVIARRMSQHGSFKGIRLGLTGPSEPRGTSIAKLYSLTIRQDE